MSLTSHESTHRNQLVVLSILQEDLSARQAALRFNLHRSRIYQLLALHKQGGLDALASKSRRPKSNPRRIDPKCKDRIIALRGELLAQGLDAGANSIAWNLNKEGFKPPAISTIWRTLKQAGLVTGEPNKKPKAYIQRFEALQPNETWQGDFTHWRLKNGKDVEIINWLDDHSRLLLHCSVYKRATGDLIVDTFKTAQKHYGTPFSTLTDNGNVYTTRFQEGTCAFEYLLAEEGIVQKNGHPGHPQTQGKIERFHQTLKKWLLSKPRAENLNQLQLQLDEFRELYNNQRPHKALGMKTPQEAYQKTIKATPNKCNVREVYRTRNDHVDELGKISLRRAGKMHHLGVGIDKKLKKVIVITDHYKVMVVEKKTGEILSQHKIIPSKTYWPNELIPEDIRRSRKPEKHEVRGTVV
jgi:transposase InsO family protein